MAGLKSTDRNSNNNALRSSFSSSGRPVSRGSLAWILICLVLSTVSFYGGLYVGWSMGDSKCLERFGNSMGTETKSGFLLLNSGSSAADSPIRQLFPHRHVGNLVSGVGLVDRDEFASKFDMGVPLDQSSEGNDQVVILYSHDHAVPSVPPTAGNVSTVDEATKNCENLHIILTDTNRKRQCVALMGQYESFHIQKFMRLPPTDPNDWRSKSDKLDMKFPLRLVNRGAQTSGRLSQKVPTNEQTREHWRALVKYFNSLDSVLDDLHPIAKEIAAHNENNAVIVMVCNFGQSELLLNFVCNAHRKSLSHLLTNILVFATDVETKDLAEGTGLKTFYNEAIFGGMPTKAAHHYGDFYFMKMMAAKVYCVQLISMLGYDVLFQDVDVIWYENPLPWFRDPTNPSYDFDVYFQDDGNHALYYAPYSANTGFYYARSNTRTRYFFNSLLMAGDLIISTHSHQNALIALLNEHASMYGLRVKIWERNLEEFPGGYSFHRKRDFMKNIFQNKVKPIIFHMSWTQSKENKIKFFQQMGEFYLQKQCQGVIASKIIMGGVDVLSILDDAQARTTTTTVVEKCCASEALFQCHYRDKPSKFPCKDSPPIDKNGKSFW